MQVILMCPFTHPKNVDGRNLQFQIVSTDVTDGIISEEAPLPGNSLAFLYRDDGRGAGSVTVDFLYTLDKVF